MAKSKNNYLVSNPAILGGTPVFAGTRVPVSTIIYLLREGYTVEAIADEYPKIGLSNIIKAINHLIHKLDDPKDASKIYQIQNSA